MTKEEIVAILNTKNGIESIIDDAYLTIKFSPLIEKDELLESLDKVYEYEKDLDEVNVQLILKGLSVELLTEALKHSLIKKDLKDPYMILNIINLIKIYNTLDDVFFEDETVYVSSIEDLLDLKLALHDELKVFIKELSIYFLSLFKSYSKTSYTPLDNHIELPLIYRAIILSTDLLTLSGIFSVSEPFNTEDCVYIDNAIKYIQHLMFKNSIGTYIMDAFFKKEYECQ